MIAILLSSLAWAQDTEATFDAYGLRPVPTYGDVRDSVGTWRPTSPLGGSIGLQVLGTYADEPLVLYSSQAGETTRDPLLNQVAGLDVMGLFALGRRVSVGVDVPIFLTATDASGASDGAALGDARLSAPVGLVVTEGEGGTSLALVPFLDVPTGDADRFLGSNNISGGGVLALGVALPQWQLTGNVGTEFAPDVELVNLQGASSFLASGSLIRLLGSNHAIGIEAQARPIFEGSTIEGAAFPAEGLLSVRGSYDSGLGWMLGGGTALSEGASAAAARAFVGLGWSQVSYERPPAPASLVVNVVDETGAPVPGAVVAVEDQTLNAGADGVASRQNLTVGEELSVSASAPGFAPAPERDVALAAGRNAVTLTVTSLPATLTVVTVGPDGQPLDAQVRLDGPAQVSPVATGADGTESVDLRHGSWRAVALADGYAPARGQADLDRGEQETLRLQLAATKVKVTETELVILEPVFFDFDKATIKPESYALLTEIADILNTRPDIRRIEVQGHADERGSDEYNLDLSQRRTDSVVQFLTERGVDPSRLVSTGYGESKPLVDGHNEAAWAKNRRVQFIILDPAAGSAAPQNQE